MITPLLLNELIGAPMAAIIEAEAQAARATADFIKEVGFTGQGDVTNQKFGEVRMVTFSYTNLGADGAEVKSTLEIPLLSLVPIPAIQVAEATIAFDLNISSSEKSPPSPGSTKDSSSLMLKKPAFQLRGLYAKSEPKSEGKDNINSTKVNMSIKIKLEQSDLTHGMVNLLNLLEKGIQEK